MPDVDVQAARDLVQRLRLAVAPMTELFGRFSDLSARKTLAVAHARRSARQSRRRASPSRPRPMPRRSYGRAMRARPRTSSSPGCCRRACPHPRSPPADYPDFYARAVAGRNRAAARARASAASHLGALRGAPAAARRRRARLAQRGHLAGGGRSGTVAQPADAQGRSACRRPRRRSARRARLHVAARRRRRLPDARRQNRRRADGAVALAAAVAGAARRRSARAMRWQPTQPWLAWARARDRIVKRAAPAGAGAAPARWRCARASSASPRSKPGSPTPTPSSPATSSGSKPCRCSAPSPTPRSAGQIVHDALGRFADRLSRHAAAPTSRRPSWRIARCGARRVRRAIRASPRSGCRDLRDLPSGSPRPSRRAADRHHASTPRSLARWCSRRPAGAVHADARAPTASTVGPAASSSTDYKTGRIPSKKARQVGGRAAAAARSRHRQAGGFTGAWRTSPCRNLRYIRATGGEPPGEVHPIERDATDIAALATTSRDGLAAPDRPFRRSQHTLPRAPPRGFADTYRFDDYAHLARVAEWSAETGEEELSMATASRPRPRAQHR